MIKNIRIKLFLITFPLLFLIETVFFSSLYAMTYFYVDPDWAGVKTGTQSEPWSTLDSSAWGTINPALTSDDVTIYFSAREAGLDTDDEYAAGIDVTNKTPNPSYTLTFDGNSTYNTNDSIPSWSTYSGNSKSKVQYFVAQNASHTKYNGVTIQGFTIERTSNGKAVSICGDNWSVRDSEITHGASVSNGPLILIVPTSDGAHEGSGSWCPASSNIIIENNTIHDSYGELIYVGGAGCTSTGNPGLSAANCNGFPSHTNITIKNNNIYSGGTRGGQGDSIDIKAAITNLSITGNNIHDLTSAAIRPIVMQGIETGGANQNIIIEKNYIHDISNVGDGMIAVVNSWGTPNGVTIRNNILDSGISGSGIRIYDTQSDGVKIYNNVIYNMDDPGLYISNGTITIQNNILLDNNSGSSQVNLSGTITATNNAYSGTWSGSCTSCVAGVTLSDFNDAVGGDFSLPDSSILIDQGITIPSFSDDWVCTSRPQGAAWDIGAFEWFSFSKSPCPPKDFIVVK